MKNLMKYINKKALEEALDAGFRTLIANSFQTVIAILSSLVLGVNAETGTIGIKWTLVLAVTIVQIVGLLVSVLIVMRDKYIHEDPGDDRIGILPNLSK